MAGIWLKWQYIIRILWFEHSISILITSQEMRFIECSTGNNRSDCNHMFSKPIPLYRKWAQLRKLNWEQPIDRFHAIIKYKNRNETVSHVQAYSEDCTAGCSTVFWILFWTKLKKKRTLFHLIYSLYLKGPHGGSKFVRNHRVVISDHYKIQNTDMASPSFKDGCASSIGYSRFLVTA